MCVLVRKIQASCRQNGLPNISVVPYSFFKSGKCKFDKIRAVSRQQRRFNITRSDRSIEFNSKVFSDPQFFAQYNLTGTVIQSAKNFKKILSKAKNVYLVHGKTIGSTGYFCSFSTGVLMS